MVPATLTLSQIRQLYGISEATLRAYEEEGLVKPIRVLSVNLYTSADRVRIEIILKAKRLGFSLGEVRLLINAHIPKPDTSVPTKGALKRQICQLNDERVTIEEAIARLRAKQKQDN